MGRFSGMTAVVTGASGGIGGAIALRYAGEGGSVCLIGRNESRLAGLASKVDSLGGEATTMLADIGHGEGANDLVARLRRDCPRIDALIHAAGLYAAGPFEDSEAADLDALLAVNLRAAYVLTRGLLPALCERHGEIVFMNSSVVQSAAGGVALYRASKAGLKALADGVREDVKGQGVRVLSVFPGRTATDMQAAIHRAEARPYAPERLLQPDDVAALVIHAMTLPRTAEVTDIFLRPMRGPDRGAPGGHDTN